MAPNWDLVSKLVFPIITALVVAAIGKRLENKPKLITYMAHAAGFVLPPVQGPLWCGDHCAMGHRGNEFSGHSSPHYTQLLAVGAPQKVVYGQ